MNRLFLMLIILLFVALSCATTKVNRTLFLKHGMTMQEVEESVGFSKQTSFVNGHLVLRYEYKEKYNKAMVPYDLVFDKSGKYLEQWYINRDDYNISVQQKMAEDQRWHETWSEAWESETPKKYEIEHTIK